MSEFQAIADRVKANGKKAGLTETDGLNLYGLFKQAKFGDNTAAKPSFYQLEDKAKWNAWNDRLGLSKDQAEKQYVTLAKQLLKQ